MSTVSGQQRPAQPLTLLSLDTSQPQHGDWEIHPSSELTVSLLSGSYRYLANGHGSQGTDRLPFT